MKLEELSVIDTTTYKPVNSLEKKTILNYAYLKK